MNDDAFYGSLLIFSALPIAIIVSEMILMFG